MLRTDAFFAFKAKDWRKKGMSTLPRFSRMRTEGLVAYAERQAAFYEGLQASCKSLWADVPAHILRMKEVIADPSKLKVGELDNKKKGLTR